MLDLLAVLCRPLLRVLFISTVAIDKGAGRDVVSEEFLVDHVHDGRDDGLDVWCSVDEGGDVV